MNTKNKEIDFYRNLRQQIDEWSRKKGSSVYPWTRWLLLGPDIFYLLIRLMADPDVPLTQKGKCAAAIGYFIMPLDLLPELIIGPTGFIDDIILAIYALNAILNKIDPELIRKHWTGQKDILRIIQTLLERSDMILGSGLFRRIKKIIK